MGHNPPWPRTFCLVPMAGDVFFCASSGSGICFDASNVLGGFCYSKGSSVFFSIQVECRELLLCKVQYGKYVTDACHSKYSQTCLVAVAAPATAAVAVANVHIILHFYNSSGGRGGCRPPWNPPAGGGGCGRYVPSIFVGKQWKPQSGRRLRP